MARYPNLWKRGSRYYLRMRVPADLRSVVKGEHHTESLGTSDPREAIGKYREAQARAHIKFQELRAALAAKDATAVALSEGRLDRLTNAQLEGLVARWWETREASRRPIVRAGEERETLATLEEDASYLNEVGVAGRLLDTLLIEAGAPVTRRRIGRPILAVDRSSEQYQFLEGVVARALLAENELARDFLSGKRIDPTRHAFPSIGNGQDDPTDLNITVAQLIARYRSYREAEYDVESTRRKYGHIFRALEEALGPKKLLKDICASDCRSVRNLLQRTPSNASKRFPNISLLEAAEKIQGTDIPRLSPTTVNSYVNNLSAIFNWAHEHQLMHSNPAKGLALRRSSPLVKRRGFDIDELNIMFSALAPLRELRPERFWIPALAHFTGARLGELCQLRVGDIILVQNIWCINFSEFDEDGRRSEVKRLKTVSSERLLPLHAQVFEAGFMDLIASRGARKDLQLFSNLSGDQQCSSHEFSKWFGRFLSSVKLHQPSLVFHSFRHGFRDLCRKSEISEETAHALGGWATINQGQRYGDRGMVQVLNRAVSKLVFDQFRLSEFLK